MQVGCVASVTSLVVSKTLRIVPRFGMSQVRGACDVVRLHFQSFLELGLV